MTARRRRWIVAVALLCLGAVAGRADDTDDTDEAHDAFARGIEAIDLGRFEAAIEPLRRAVALDPKESEDRVFLSGVFSRPYLPQFYLGWALAEADRCDEAVAPLDRSEGQGVVQRFSRQYAELVDARQRCVATLLPAAAAEARRSLARATTAAERSTRPADDADRRGLADEHAAVVEALDEALDAGDLDGVRAVGERAARIVDAFDELARSDAEATRLARLESRREAESAAPPPPPPSRPVISTPPPSIPPPSTAPPPTRDRELARRLVALAAEAESFLDRLPEAGDPDGLVARHRARCRRLARRARALAADGSDASDADRASTREELARSLDATRFVAGANALLAGEPRQALERLGDEPGDARLLAHHYLVESAARFAVYRLGGELDPVERSRAVDAARASRVALPTLEPSASVFSPAFRAFFADSVGEEPAD